MHFYYLLEEKIFQISVPTHTQFSSIPAPLDRKRILFLPRVLSKPSCSTFRNRSLFFFICGSPDCFYFSIIFQISILFCILTNPRFDLLLSKSYLFCNYWLQVWKLNHWYFFHNSAFRLIFMLQTINHISQMTLPKQEMRGITQASGILPHLTNCIND